MKLSVEKQIKELANEVRELKAMIAQLGPVSVEPTYEQEAAAVKAQGIDLAEYYKQNG